MTKEFDFEKFDFEKLVRESLDKAVKERGHVNIVIVGATGVGKSTLINAVFQGNFATTGSGSPITPDINEIKKEGIPISIIDTRGLEMKALAETREALYSLVKKRSKETDRNKHIHVAWLCISEDSRRVQEAEEELVNMLADYMPVIAVITKAKQDKAPNNEGKRESFYEKVKEKLPLTKNVIRVRSIPEELDNGLILEAKGLDELVNLTMEVIPEGHRRAFAAAQKADIELKKDQCRVIVAAATAAAVGIGAIPIPLSDAFGIIPIQIGMITGISVTFGLSFNESFYSSIVGSVVTGAGGTLTGRAIVTGLLKLVPGGQIAGGLIAGGTAGTLTALVGETYIAILERLFIKNHGNPPNPDDVLEAFREESKNLMQKKTNEDLQPKVDNKIDEDLQLEVHNPSQLAGKVESKYAEQEQAGNNLVRLDPDVAKVFPNEKSVNKALRSLMKIAQRLAN
ncbi:YcjF family protein [Roseofilum capinflatum]|uniref:DUF697 domain-containing protein n=1 Tax=Roseofilum capinflatum BLCC-M114 TaxID=3022440 RepID=A0ABT7B4L0_9CYAN|nr:GTPase [Roseofilum capinflatum]MDJ1173451.1 DUF697 domain-containing protein [Roseofilum capinflatum BLCC-M114]